ncbi:Histone deacetylase-like amidohydrolase [Planctomycetes bacterium Poly30]|uniref:Histone deacetylase-like amidohydrolase n=1 Tax=Saltatorellus ferox TaxID=2528018 RepID=A0A518EMY4_9BACT|nr:Histone deacetylase-like amidohydrolase [Planctomycetes bacterium Poly30]
MRVFYCDHFEVILPPNHRFPMQKYGLLRRRLVDEGLVEEADLIPARAAPLEDIYAVHDAGYVQGFLDGTLDRKTIQRIGFPWSESMVMRSLGSVGSTLGAVEAALEDGISGSLAGGTHHAYRDFGSGYCIFNDLAIAARRLLDRGSVERVLIFDVDVHQGDGTASIFADDRRVFTCSLHGARNFPSRKQSSDLDVPLEDGLGDDDYLAALDGALDEAMERARPDIVLYQGGVDVLEADRLGRLGLTREGCRERDLRSLRCFRGAGLPVALTLGGGYADPIDASVDAYAGTYRAARSV